MNVSDGPRRATFVRLPGDVQRPFQVFLNGVEPVSYTHLTLPTN